MGRTRSAVLDGAARAVEKHGARKATMADIAALAGVAKGTLYNHFRAKEAVFAAAVDAGVRSLVAECIDAAREDLADSLALAADRVGGHPALRRIAADEPATLAVLVTVDEQPVWGLARSGMRDILVAGGCETPSGADVDLVLRWVLSTVATRCHDSAEQAARLAGCLSAAAPSAALG